MFDRKISLVTARILIVFSAFFLLSLVLFIWIKPETGALSLLSLPGFFIFRSLHWGSFLLPLYFLLWSIFLFYKGFNRGLFFLCSVLFLPLLTFSIAFKMIFVQAGSPLEEAIAMVFGYFPGSILLLCLALLEIFILTRIYHYFFVREKTWSDLKKTLQDFFETGKNKDLDDEEDLSIKNNQNDKNIDQPLKKGEEDQSDDKQRQHLMALYLKKERNISEEDTLPPPPEKEIIPEKEAVSSSGLLFDSQSAANQPVSLPPSQKQEENQDNQAENNHRQQAIDYASLKRKAGKDNDADYFDQFDSGSEENTSKSYKNKQSMEGLWEDIEDAEFVHVDDDQNLQNDYEEVEELPRIDEIGESDFTPREELFGDVSNGRFNRHNYNVPVEGLLKIYQDEPYWEIDAGTRRAAQVLKETLEEFKIQADVTGIRKGPVITMFEILPAPGVKLSKISNLADNIALRLAASSVRIVAPIPGKHAVGIEVPNKDRYIVSFSEMVSTPQFTEDDHDLPVILGKDITGEIQVVDLCRTPHMLIAGATGSGKSVCVNSLICSLLYACSPQEVKLMLIDPKIVELKFYNDIPHLLTPVITEAKKALQAIQYLLFEMEKRYAMLDNMGVRDISSYNNKVKNKKLAAEAMPYIVLVVDEFADLMATSGKELESTLARLAAMSRAVGIHLVLATQRPSIDVITGLIKANFPSRIAFMVAGKTDSRIIIDTIGAEKLLGKGDMLFTSAWAPFPSRIQGAFLSEDEVEQVVDYVKGFGEPDYIDDEIFVDDEEESEIDFSGVDDPLMDKAVEVVVQAGKASASYLQRRLKVGYNRAARLVENMEDRGIVGPQNGSKPREILHIPDRQA